MNTTQRNAEENKRHNATSHQKISFLSLKHFIAHVYYGSAKNTTQGSSSWPPLQYYFLNLPSLKKEALSENYNKIV